jgi:hypothetical protein
MPTNWEHVETGADSVRRWKHTSEDIWMTMSHQPDHYGDGSASCYGGKQVMRWHVRPTLGKNITFGEGQFFMCEKLGHETAEQKAEAFAMQWMNQHADSTYEELSR